ncbi:MYND-type zinc finger protein samB [Golovinomyces cichoracearum]|uniref:MYND-type zinc finger protein samB n=1 Tax=Golovinomyces cichoracearum TaxID=62708 RepID=A0A420ISQ9_9PEZI|nr:MYND-type zinc finger protein samB [Golovinomyces cichoracearum]
MREVNFSIPNVNKASVGITTALYDRRALDCTSTLPLINSLNHLAYLTTSSARIRDILTVDGGVERLVCLLKAGRSKDPMDMWKWNLAFQCVVNVGVRGSENVRTRIVEADLIPVIATILDNYIKVVDRCREKAEEAMQAQEQRLHASRAVENQISSKNFPFGNRSLRPQLSRGSRRQPPPPSIDIPLPLTNGAQTMSDAMEITPTTSQPIASSLPERANFTANRRHYHHRIQDVRQHSLPSRYSLQSLGVSAPPMDTADGLSIRPVRDVDRLPSMVAGFQNNHVSRPDSPTTPLPTSSMYINTSRPDSIQTSALRQRRRPNIRHQTSIGVGEDLNADSMVSDEPRDPEISGVSTATIQSSVNFNIQEIGMDDSESILNAVESRLGLNPPTASDTQGADNFTINHRSTLNGSLIDNAALQAGPNNGFMPVGEMMGNTQLNTMNSNLSRYLLDRPVHCQVLAAMPREDDILMSLQLLAYVSKYCNLRSYFQKSHLVPKLKIGSAINLLDLEDVNLTPSSSSIYPTASSNGNSSAENEEEEYLLPDDYNIFPLVEKFTIRHHSHDMQYWAGVVMRNLCRKDDSRGGIRQCAHYQCGKWEQYTRQFAKCRRCRRTKYCSKECQKSAWIFHRHWCVAATP